MSQLLTHSSGRIFWIGNISSANCRGNHPRHPLVIGEVDPESLLLTRDSVVELDRVQPDEGDVDGVDDHPVAVLQAFEDLAGENDHAEDHTPEHDHTPDAFEEPIEDEAFFNEPSADRLPDFLLSDDTIRFTASDLSQEEKDELIRNIGKGIFPA
jgi:hypothetical protein